MTKAGGIRRRSVALTPGGDKSVPAPGWGPLAPLKIRIDSCPSAPPGGIRGKNRLPKEIAVKKRAKK